MKYHLIGNMGISMMGLQKILESEGNIVTGSDLKNVGHLKENVTSDVDVVVRTSAVSEGSPGWVEVLRARELNIPVIKRSELIKEITKDKYLISISGMHGKTTVTSLIGLILIQAGLDPTVLVGEHISEFGGDTVRIGKSKYFVLEACEYDKSFYDFFPDICVITNLDLEHLDTFPNGMPDILDAFSIFIKNIKDKGSLVYCQDDPNLQKVADTARSDIGKVAYMVQPNDSKLLDSMSLMGKHNRLNAEAAIGVARLLDISDGDVLKVLSSFKGAKRRLEYYGEIKGAKIYDDYGHHPTEVSSTILALREKYPDKKIRTIFWPHQYKRILPLRRDFVDALAKSDEVILKPIFFVPGRDQILNISSDDLSDDLRAKGVKSKVMENDDEIAGYLAENASSDTIILTIGIPPVYKIAQKLVE